jgi:RNA polymerase sigma-70 factor, ECF subfamily
VNELASNVERHRRELLVHCYRILGSLPDAEDAVQETLLRAWRYRDSLKEGAPLRPCFYRVATNACLDAIARDERRAVLATRAAADNDSAGKPDDGPITKVSALRKIKNLKRNSNERCNLRNQHYPGWLLRPHQSDCR